MKTTEVLDWWEGKTSTAKSNSWGCLQWCSSLNCSSQLKQTSVEHFLACVNANNCLGKAEGIEPNKEGVGEVDVGFGAGS